MDLKPWNTLINLGLKRLLVKSSIVDSGIKSPERLHYYGYCANNPINYIDIYGYSAGKVYYATPPLPGVMWQTILKLKEGDTAVFPLYPFTAQPEDVAYWYIVGIREGKLKGRFYFGPLLLYGGEVL